MIIVTSATRLHLQSQPRGVALVLVLVVLVLITVLVVGFLSLVTTERQASAGYAEGNRSRMLSDSAVNMVISQVRQATENLGSAQASPKTWASQPGMIRVYGTTGGTGNGRTALTSAYKLYSSDTMVVSSFGMAEAAAEVPPAAWSGQRALYTDLNEPVEVQGRKHYPVLDPPALGEVAGYEVVDAPAPVGTDPVMPVKWLYLLRDGTVAAATPVAGSGSRVTVTGATAGNPVIGRLAFWTDDETSKVNINTASEGVFWDIPRANTVSERRLASYLPARNEFQRYPGHPAMTSLSTVLGNYLTFGGGSTTGSNANGTSQFGLYYDLAPRVQTGGSLDGTRTPTGAMVITKDQDRLYATVDEYFFKGTALAGGERELNSTRLNPEILAKTQFFLTAQSRAPEVTLFNTPRISLWPLQVVQSAGVVTARNANDKLIAFCSSLGKDKTLPANYPSDQTTGNLYAFQRRQVSHLVASNPASPGSASATADYALIPRNQVIYNYLKTLTNREIPGFGGTFISKYPNDRDQILTECFDYTRSLVNAISTPQLNLQPHYSYAPYYYDFGVVAPIKINNTAGQGRFFTVAQAALIFYPTQVDTTNASDVKTLKMKARVVIQPYCISPGQSAFNQKYQLQVTDIKGFKADDAPLRMSDVAGNTGLLNVNYNEGYYTADTWIANKTALPSPGGQFFKYQSGFGGNLVTAGTANQQFDVWASVADVDVAGKTSFSFNGGTATVKVNLQDGTNVQTLKIDFPAQTLPVPKRTGSVNDAGKVADVNNAKIINLDYRERFNASLPTPVGTARVNISQILMNNLVYPGDTVYAMTVNPADKARGDMRLIAYRSSLDATEKDFFAPHTNLRGASLRVGYDPTRGQFRKDWTTVYKNAETGGRLVENMNYPESAVPFVPTSLNGAKNQYDAPGDWDTGYDLQEDGPYVNKADEGATNRGYFTRGLALGFVSANFGDGANGSQAAETDNITYSPNRQIASAVMYGSLPTGVFGKTTGK
ncbi:MAG TPA: Verru_Chthon cassette protein A, partial [Verrucomicrobium sp.]|nr:Verru_Chthon cassette protein A [Verrucomicrobium sp.]